MNPTTYPTSELSEDESKRRKEAIDAVLDCGLVSAEMIRARHSQECCRFAIMLRELDTPEFKWLEAKYRDYLKDDPEYLETEKLLFFHIGRAKGIPEQEIERQFGIRGDKVGEQQAKRKADRDAIELREAAHELIAEIEQEQYQKELGNEIPKDLDWLYA